MNLELEHRLPGEVFLEMLEETAGHLERATYVDEWLGPRRRLPVFDVAPLRDFAIQPANRRRLTELLVSYVKVRSGSFWERSGGRWRRRRYSELDPFDLAELGAFGRLGDLALFLSGVFPEHAAANALEPRTLARLARALEAQPGELARTREAFWLLEWVGRAAYTRAGETHLAADFHVARRLLNVLTGRHLFAHREQWFAGPG